MAASSAIAPFYPQPGSAWRAFLRPFPDSQLGETEVFCQPAKVIEQNVECKVGMLNDLFLFFKTFRLHRRSFSLIDMQITLHPFSK